MSTPTPDTAPVVDDVVVDDASAPAPALDSPNPARVDATAAHPADGLDSVPADAGPVPLTGPPAAELTDAEKIDLILKYVANHSSHLKFVADSVARVEALATDAKNLAERAVAHARDLGDSPILKQLGSMFGLGK